MLKIVSAVVAAALAFTSVSSANASGPAPWRYSQTGGWNILVDPTTGNGCFAITEYQRGSIVRIGLDKNNGRIYLLFGNTGWRTMEVGKHYDVVFLFDGVSRYTGDVTVKDMGQGSTFLLHNNISADFARDFAARNNLQIFWGDRSLLNVSLANTTLAVNEVIRCQQQVDGSPSPSVRSQGGPGEVL